MSVTRAPSERVAQVGFRGRDPDPAVRPPGDTMIIRLCNSSLPHRESPGPRGAHPVLPAALLLGALVACSDSDSGGPQGTSPTVSGFALLTDENRTQTLDEGDVLTVRFDRPVTLRDATAADFELAVEGDSFGDGATVRAGSRPEEVQIVLGSAPRLRAVGMFASTRTAHNAPSGLDVAPDADGVLDVATGRAAAPVADDIDIAPAFVAAPEAAHPKHKGAVTAAGDLDGDGDTDLVVGIDGATDVVWLNDGSGTFTVSGATLGSGGRTTALALADFDRDGDLDVLVGEANAPDTVWLNDGTADFTPGATLSTSRTSALAVGDVDRDGDVDVVQGNRSGEYDRLWLNDGSAGFTDAGRIGGRDNTHTVLLADLDGDRRLDVVQGTSGPNSIYFGDGTGDFTDSGQRVGTGSTRSLAAGDVDCDGDVDLVVAGRDPSQIWLNDGTGQFTPTDRLANAATDHVVLVDVDADGDLDVFAGNGNRQPDEIWFIDGNGNLVDSGQRLGDRDTLGVTAADVDGDGDVDLIAANVGEAPYVWLNSVAGSDGEVEFTLVGAALDSATVRDFGVADFDGDGDPDLVGTHGNGIDAELADNDGTGAFVAPRRLELTGGAEVVHVAHVDDDGAIDLVLGGTNLQPAVWLGDGAGGFTSTPPLTLASIRDARTDDVNRDGRTDLVLVEGGGSAGVQVWLQDATGTFPSAGQQFGADVRTTALADLDGDGNRDLLLGTDAGLVLALHDGAGAFAAPAPALGTDPIDALATGDVDGDGDVDVVLGGPSGTALWLNDGTGQITVSPPLLGDETSALVLADVDRDGDLDLLRGDASTADQLLRNDGQGGLTVDAGVTLWDGPTVRMQLVDLDCDGDRDLLVSTGSSAAPGVQVLRRD